MKPTALPPIYGHENVLDFLNELLVHRKKKNPRYSVRAWAKQLGFQSPSLLLNVLSGDRKVSSDLGKKIAATVPFSRDERTYFDLLVLANQAKSEEELELYRGLRERLRPDDTSSALKLAHFKLISEWYHLTLLEMLSLADFKPDPGFISRRLRGKISAEQVELAIGRLRRLGLLKGERGTPRRARGNPVLKDEIPSDAIRNHHREMMTRAREALREQAIEERDFRVTKLAIRKKDYSRAKDLIKDCHRALQKLSIRENADDVYALNTQFFKLTGDAR